MPRRSREEGRLKLDRLDCALRTSEVTADVEPKSISSESQADVSLGDLCAKERLVRSGLGDTFNLESGKCGKEARDLLFVLEEHISAGVAAELEPHPIVLPSDFTVTSDRP